MKLLFAVALCAVLSTFGCGRAAQPVQASTAAAPAADPSGAIVLPADSPKLAHVHVSPVRMVDVPVDEVTAPGKVEVNPHGVAHVVMPTPGRIREALVKLGDHVDQGQPLLKVDSAEAGAAAASWRQAQAQVRQAGSTLRKVQADLSRVRDLYQHRAAAEKEVLTAENELAQAQAASEQAQAAADDAAHRLEILGLSPGQSGQDLVVKSPISGKVIEIGVAPGEFRNDTNASLLTVADLRTVWISADVPETAIRLVRPGEAAQVELAAYPGEIFRARVTRIADMVDPQTRTIKVQAEIANPGGRLRPEMFGQIRHSHAARRMPAVPAGAVLQRNGESLVLLEEAPGRFRERTVTTGLRREELVPVLSGLAPGDRVVVDGAMLLNRN